MKNFQDTLLDQLTDPAVASAYLNEHIQFKGPDATELLLDAVRNVMRAQGIDKIAKEAGISRRTLYHAVSKNGNPSVDLFFKILNQLQVDVQFVSKKSSRTKRASKKAA